MLQVVTCRGLDCKDAVSTYWRMNVLTYWCIDVWTSERMDVHTYEQMSEWTYEQMDVMPYGWMTGGIAIRMSKWFINHSNDWPSDLPSEWLSISSNSYTQKRLDYG